jgi:hypothetical protein
MTITISTKTLFKLIAVLAIGAGAWFGGTTGFQSFLAWKNAPPELNPFAKRIIELLESTDGWRFESQSGLFDRSLLHVDTDLNISFKLDEAITKITVGGVDQTSMLSEKEIAYIGKKVAKITPKLRDLQAETVIKQMERGPDATIRKLEEVAYNSDIEKSILERKRKAEEKIKWNEEAIQKTKGEKSKKDL